MSQTTRERAGRGANMTNILFGRRLRAARIAAGFNVSADFAGMLSMNNEEYDALERGGDLPNIDTLVYIARVTGRSLHWLLTGERPEGE